MAQFEEELLICIQNYPVIYIPHFHQKYICDEIEKTLEKLCINNDKDIIIKTIDCTHNDVNNNDDISQYDYVESTIMGIGEYISGVKEDIDYSPCICIIRNVYSELLNDARFISLVHEFVEYYEERGKLKPYNCLSIVLCVPSCEMPPSSISSISYVVNIKPPCDEDIEHEISQYGMKGDEAIITEYIHALQGLHLFDIRQIINSTRNEYGSTLYKISVKFAYEEKQELVRKTGVLEVVKPDVTLTDIGGLETLKDDIKKIGTLYKNLSLLRAANVPIPKGFLLLGMPGCGKSMIAKATADEFGCPLLKLDMGKLLGKYVGDSEHNLQMALDVVDSAHPCVLWIDEIEKAFAGTNNVSGEGDSVMMRLMGKFLYWMQERKTAVFIMATANDVLKPELMRKGRFDEVYFIDFPTTKEAAEIVRMTLDKYAIKSDDLFTQVYIEQIAEIMTKSEADKIHCLSGAEIKSLMDSFIAGRIAEFINNGNNGNANLKNFSITRKDKDKFESQLGEAKKSAMINQKKSGTQDKEVNNSFIDKIYAFQEQYKFKHA